MSGTVFLETPERRAFRRWQDHEFLDLERHQAKAWRNSLSGIDLNKEYSVFQSWIRDHGRPRSLAEVKAQVDTFMLGRDREFVLRAVLGLVGFSQEGRDVLVGRWRNAGKPPLGEFAPYLMHVSSVDLVFSIGIAAELIGRKRPSNKVDLAYLYYLPFCSVFSSRDKLHLRLAPLFVRENQSFVNGDDLKTGLSALESFFRAYPEEVKARGLSTFAICPPSDTSYLVTRLWDRHMAPNWREILPAGARDSGMITPGRDPSLDRLMRFAKAAPSAQAVALSEPGMANVLMVQQRALYEKGKWVRFPPETFDSPTNRFRDQGMVQITMIYS